MKNIILNEGEIICPVCNGIGHLKNSIYVCEKCDGVGKVDWVSNVIIRKKKKRSVLDRINVKRTVMHINSLVNSLQFEPLDNLTMDTLKGMMDHYLATIKDKKAIDDYQINELPSYPGAKNLSVSIKFNRSVEVVKIDFHIL